MRVATIGLFMAAFMSGTACAEDLDLEGWWRDACLWEVGSNLEKVPAARKKLIEAGAPTLDFLIPGKLTAADTIITRALSMVITGIAGTATQKPQSPELRNKALAGLINALTSTDAVTRRNAADLLGQMGATEAADRIAPLLKDKEARGGALAALGALKAESCVPDIAEMARDATVTERGRFTAVATLGAIGGRLAQEALLSFLSDKTATVRFAAQYALEALSSTGALVAKLRDPDRRARLHAISALGRIGDRSTRADLRPLLDDPDATVRGFAVEALSSMQKPSDAAWIRERMRSEKDEFVKGKLIEAMKRVESGGTE
ncbi:MAG: HEAT repeat domain-containing protein [Planctomycetota bacterium]